MRARQMQTVLPVSELNRPATGWPFVPVNPPPSEATTFESLLDRVSAGRAATDLCTQALAAVPLRTPVVGETNMTSPFGIRMHPILTYRNTYRGIDLRGDLGELVQATATGKVTVPAYP
jgi:murein DD-endopeptidase MepM/ murein hydrolase activator NlpD